MAIPKNKEIEKSMQNTNVIFTLFPTFYRLFFQAPFQMLTLLCGCSKSDKSGTEAGGIEKHMKALMWSNVIYAAHLETRLRCRCIIENVAIPNMVNMEQKMRISHACTYLSVYTDRKVEKFT